MRKRKYEIVEGLCCGTCYYYKQHYVQWGGPNRFSALSYGHCTYPRMKVREPHQTCEHWRANK